MHFTIQREALLKPLQLVAGVVERRQTLPVLSNVLLVVEGQQLSLTGTDLEVELVGRVTLEDAAEPGEITVPARKLMDICKSLPSDVLIDIRVDEQKLLVKAGRSRFTLSTLPANDFPTVEEGPGSLTFSLAQSKLRRLIDRTSFAMAQQDVRYYLNGMLLEVGGGTLRAVATDGHRLAMCSLSNAQMPEAQDRHQVIVPRKGILELARLLTEQDGEVCIVLGQHHIRATTGEFTFTSKLVDGKFPDYERVLPKGGDKLVVGDRQVLREAFSRTAILSNEKYRGIRLQLSNGLLKIQANNPEQEEAEEEVQVDYNGGSLEIGFNVSYLLDVLGVMGTEQVRLILSDSNSSALLQEADNDDSAYVVMPMRLYAYSMSLTRLSVTAVRNLHPVTLSPSPRINILYGDNGSGKTSVLEAIHLLGLARSFRSMRLQPVIQYEEPACTVFGQVMLGNGFASNLGVSRERQGEFPIRIDGQNARSAAQLAETLAAAADQPGQFPFAGRSAEDPPTVPRLGCVPRGTSLPARLATPAEGPAPAELLAPAW